MARTMFLFGGGCWSRQPHQYVRRVLFSISHSAIYKPRSYGSLETLFINIPPPKRRSAARSAINLIGEVATLHCFTLRAIGNVSMLKHWAINRPVKGRQLGRPKPVSLFLCFFVSLFLCFFVSCFFVSLFLCFFVSLFLCFFVLCFFEQSRLKRVLACGRFIGQFYLWVERGICLFVIFHLFPQAVSQIEHFVILCHTLITRWTTGCSIFILNRCGKGAPSKFKRDHSKKLRSKQKAARPPVICGFELGGHKPLDDNDY